MFAGSPKDEEKKEKVDQKTNANHRGQQHRFDK